MNELVMDSTHTTFLISRRTTFRKGVPRAWSEFNSIVVTVSVPGLIFIGIHRINVF